MKQDICYHISHEQFSPSECLRLSTLAAKSGFDSIHCSDHFHPWSHRQGQSGMAWTWLGASMHANNCPHGLVCAPGQRYHPAIIAQSIATLLDLFGNRLWVSLGTGQALNESITGNWPPKEERKTRLLECVDVMKRLWKGEVVTHSGLIEVHGAQLFTLPKEQPFILAAALTDETAAWASAWADGLITVASSPDDVKRKRAIFSGTTIDTRPLYVKIDVAFDYSVEEALIGAHDQWSTNCFGSPLQAELPSPSAYEEATKNVTVAEMIKHVFVCTDANEFSNLVESYFEAGATKLIVHNVTRKQEEFLQFWKTEVKPTLLNRKVKRGLQ